MAAVWVALVVWLNFLHVFGRRWDQATARDVEAFKHWRLTDLGNAGRVAPTSFDTDRAALKTFYTWSSARYGSANPIPAVAGSGSRLAGEMSQILDQAGRGRDPLRPAGARRRQVKWMLRPAFEQWRDVGLRGYGLDGLRKPGWRGENEDRDAAFADGLYGSGLRLSEWASVLDVEIPAPGEARWAKAWLAADARRVSGTGGSTSNAQRIAYCMASRFGASSPNARVRKVSTRVTTAMATGSAAPPRKANAGASGSASATAAVAEARNPAKVMPIWMVARNRLGSRANRTNVRGPRPAAPLQLLELALAQRDQRDLAAGEQRVEHHQHPDQHQIDPIAIHGLRTHPSCVEAAR